MDDLLKIPARKRGIPAWRLCVLMALTFLLALAGAPRVFAVIGAI